MEPQPCAYTDVLPHFSTISDGTDSVRPATLRGLGPDQLLVMVNGKRRHASALVNVGRTPFGMNGRYVYTRVSYTFEDRCLRLVLFHTRREALPGVEGFVETDPFDIVEGDGGGVGGPVADGEVEVAVAEDFVLADEVAHAGATVLVRLQAADLQLLASALGGSFKDADLFADLLHLVLLLGILHPLQRLGTHISRVGGVLGAGVKSAFTQRNVPVP